MARSHLLQRASAMNGWRRLLVVACAIPGALSAQDSSQAILPAASFSLSLDEALRQARAHSPAYRQTLNDATPGRWGVGNAYGSLLPSVSASSDFGYSGSGQSNYGGGLILPTSPFVTSGYSLGLQWQVSGRTLTAPAQQKALQRATDEDISGAAIMLTSEISTQYLN